MIRTDKIHDYNELKSLLIKNGAYYSFLENLTKEKMAIGSSIQYTLRQFINETEPIEYINLAFSWTNSNQGFEYWAEIDRQWLKIIC